MVSETELVLDAESRSELKDTPFTQARLHPDDLAQIVSTLRVQSPWMVAREAADYLRCPVSRIRKLTMTNELPMSTMGAGRSTTAMTSIGSFAAEARSVLEGR